MFNFMFFFVAFLLFRVFAFLCSVLRMFENERTLTLLLSLIVLLRFGLINGVFESIDEGFGLFDGVFGLTDKVYETIDENPC